MFRNSKHKAQLIVMATFLLGAFSGGLVTYIVQQQQAKQTTTVLDEVDRRVVMQPEQRIQVEAVLRDARQQYKNLKLQHRPEFDAVRESARGKIRSLLNAEQQARFDQYVKELDAKREAARQAETVAK
jgi:uncharacterized membrane protein